MSGNPTHWCGREVVDAVTMLGRPGYQLADWYCPACRQYLGDQDLDRRPSPVPGADRPEATITVLVREGRGVRVFAKRDGKRVFAAVVPGENWVTAEELDVLRLEPTWDARVGDGQIVVGSKRDVWRQQRERWAMTTEQEALDAIGYRDEWAAAEVRDLENATLRRPSVLYKANKTLADWADGCRLYSRATKYRRRAERWRKAGGGQA